MNAARWQQVKQVLDQALTLLDFDKRQSFLDEACQDDVALRFEVESLLSSHDQAGTGFLNGPALKPPWEAVMEEAAPTRVGAYRLMEEIGRGGMAEVYRAVRADGQYDKEVAIKLIRAGFNSSSLQERFRSERQILASLNHPNIAGLLDGGTTEEGVAYLVMELIEGSFIDRYCNDHNLSVTERLKLFRRVCAAVNYAHQRLVVHRDIKPSNIMVSGDGVPKLLDFGIAKLLDPSTEAGVTMARLMTPEYASPEQIRGEPITTATDVYSLGVVLYQLLTGTSPYTVDANTPHGLARAICEDDPVKPSAAVVKAQRKYQGNGDQSETIVRTRENSPAKLRRRLTGDLDNIVLKALRKEPSQRYASVEQLMEDIRRHLEHIPVQARKDTLRYRTVKLLKRHKTVVAASGIVILAIVIGLVVSLREARLARRQAEIASAQRARAERRFNDVRKLANSLMFEVHDSIKDLPGAMSTRKLVVDKALEYLDSLSNEASGDAALQHELAAAYDRVGDLLGYNGAANLGDIAGALQSYDKALSIRESAAAANPDDLQVQSDLMISYFHLSFVQQDAGNPQSALDYLQKALPVAQKLANTHPEPKYQDWLAGFYWETGNALSWTSEYARALENYRTATSIREPIARDPEANGLFRTHLAGDYDAVGRMLWRTGDLEQGLVFFRKGLQILQQLSQSRPNDATLREYVAETFVDMAQVLEDRGDLNEALESRRNAHAIFSELTAHDPTNQLARNNSGFAEIGMGQVLMQQGKLDEAISHIQIAMRLFESSEPKKRFETAGQARSYSTLAIVYSRLADRDVAPKKKVEHLSKARLWLQKSLSTWQLDPNHGSPDPFGGREGDVVKAQLERCEALLAKLNAPQLP